MADHADLIRRLRIAAKTTEGQQRPYSSSLMVDAADALEASSRERLSLDQVWARAQQSERDGTCKSATDFFNGYRVGIAGGLKAPKEADDAK